MKRLFTRLATLFALAAALPAHALEYNAVEPDKSQIAFGYRQMGVTMEGRFRRFTARLAFDPAKPTAARASLDVDLTSVDAGYDEANGELAGKDWFNTKAYPTAHFETVSVKALAGNKFELRGRLTIKGRGQDIVLPASFTPQGAQGAFDGGFQIKRADFAIGEGAWADFGAVANEISIKFHIQASARK